MNSLRDELDYGFVTSAETIISTTSLSQPCYFNATENTQHGVMQYSRIMRGHYLLEEVLLVLGRKSYMSTKRLKDKTQ